MAVLNNNQLGGASGQAGGYFLEDSLRFRSSASAQLSRTPASATNRRTFTYSCWVKKSLITVDASPYPSQKLLFAEAGGNTNDQLGFLPTNTLRFFGQVSGSDSFNLTTTQLFRDASAWYHIVLAVDTTQSTAANRVKLYVNGAQITAFDTETYPSLNFECSINNNIAHYIGGNNQANAYLDGYLTEVNFVDGTALAPSDFGETDDNGTWIPKKYTGTYGTNGFYLPMKPTTQATGFNTVLYTGNGGTQDITGVGFTPDLVWVKNRDESSRFNLLTDTIRGVTKSLASNLTDAESSTTYSTGLTAFGTDGFSVGSLIDFNGSADKMVAWCWDAGGSTVSNTDGSITSSIRANPSTGFSIVTYSGNSASSATVGHGLGVAPKMVIVKARNLAAGWPTQVDGTYGLRLNSTGANDSANGNVFFANTAPTASVFTVGDSDEVNDGYNYVAYCFADVTGYQKLGSYTGNGSTTGPSVTGLGFQPAWILIKSTSIADEWVIFDNTRNPSNPTNLRLNPNSDGAEQSSQSVNILSDGFQPITTGANINQNGATYIYMAIADTRNAKFNFDASGNKNNWTPNNINSNASGESSYDLMSDVPTLTDEDTSNFATLNPLVPSGSVTINQANLKATSGTNAQRSNVSTISVSSGKYYWETTWNTVGANDAAMTGIIGVDNLNPDSNFGGTNSYAYVQDGGKQGAGSYTGSYGDRYVAGDIIGTALDLDAGTITFYRNGTTQGTAFTSLPSVEYYLGCSFYNSGDNFDINFGQRPFAYTPPSGFKKINAYNLPDSTIVDGSEHFDTALWTGNGSASGPTVSSLKFKPQFLWSKRRDAAANNYIYDTVRHNSDSPNKFINTNNTDAEQIFNAFTLADNGFTLATDNVYFNASSGTYVSWNWKTAGYGSSNTDGDITSTVSANTTAGFSVVTYTGTGATSATIGHGLGIAPKMIILKSRSVSSTYWLVGHDSIGWTKGLYLNVTNAAATYTPYWNNTAPDSDKFTLGNWGVDSNGSGSTYVAYCFAPVEGYSKFGSYYGNASANGPFVYTGFRPRFIMFKNASDTRQWGIVDTARSTYNQTNATLEPSTSNAENTSDDFDIFSNGFRPVTTDPGSNGSGNTIIYMAFAENPFKNSNAR